MHINKDITTRKKEKQKKKNRLKRNKDIFKCKKIGKLMQEKSEM